MSVRAAVALAACLALGAVLGLSILEFGVLGFVTAPATLLALGLFLLQSDTRTRLQTDWRFHPRRWNRRRRIAGVPRYPHRERLRWIRSAKTPAGGGGSYECYSIETLWALIPYVAFVCLGGFMLFIGLRGKRA